MAWSPPSFSCSPDRGSSASQRPLICSASSVSSFRLAERRRGRRVADQRGRPARSTGPPGIINPPRRPRRHSWRVKQLGEADLRRWMSRAAAQTSSPRVGGSSMPGRLARARECYVRRASRDAYDGLLGGRDELAAEDLERLAVSACLVGSNRHSDEAWEAGAPPLPRGGRRRGCGRLRPLAGVPAGQRFGLAGGERVDRADRMPGCGHIRRRADARTSGLPHRTACCLRGRAHQRRRRPGALGRGREPPCRRRAGRVGEAARRLLVDGFAEVSAWTVWLGARPGLPGDPSRR